MEMLDDPHYSELVKQQVSAAMVIFESARDKCGICADAKYIYLRIGEQSFKVNTKEGYYATPTMEFIRDGVQAAVEMVVEAIAGAVDSTQEG